MDRLGDMVVFVRAVEDGGFSAAGRSLMMTPSAVSKLITRLERRLDVTLFNRSSRMPTLTEEGRTFYASALRAIEAVEEAETSVFGGKAVRGLLRIRSMPSFATHQLAPRMPAFRRLYPELRLDFVLNMDANSMLDGGVDVAIHVGELTDSSLIINRFASTRWIVCAAPSYLAERGTPDTPDDLAEHDCLNFPSTVAWSIWNVRAVDGEQRRLRPSNSVSANTGQMLLSLALAGAGIVRLAEYQIIEELKSGQLVELISQHNIAAEDPIYAVYTSKRHLSQRIRVFIDFLRSEFGNRRISS